MSLLESLLDNLLNLLSLRWLRDGIRCDNRLERFNVESVSCGHQVVVVYNLDKRLNLSSLGNFLSTHGLGYLQRLSLDTGDNGVWERVRLGTLIVWLNNDNFLTSVTSTDNDSYNVSRAL